MDHVTHGGTEKQVAWANRIAATQLGLVDVEIERNEARLKSTGEAWIEGYLADLRARRATLVAGFETLGAKKVIDLHVAGRANLADELIARARAAL